MGRGKSAYTTYRSRCETMNTMTYQGYLAYIEYSNDDDEFVGTVMNTSKDNIYFGGKTVTELKRHFQEAVDTHIKNCKALGMEAEKPYSGRISYRTTPEQHAKLIQAASKDKKRSVNAWIDDVLHKEIEKVLSQ
jgi:predicted HicB family RNase H-like nuclease